VQFWFTVEPEVETVKRQQTPKPEAQLPLATPPMEVHLLDSKQVPFRKGDWPEVRALLLRQPSFLKVTTEKIEKTFPVGFSFPSSPLESVSLDACSQFHQHFTRKFFVQIMFW